MNRIQLGWIDYSSEHRNKVLAVLSLLTAPGAVDELGIGQIRDGFADLLFPGTSTIHTRAKYFFLIPYLCMELEQQRSLAPKSFLRKLNEMELDLIEPLKNSGETGVIGATAGRGLKRKPSSIYWTGLRTLGIFRYPHLSLEDYARTVCAVNQELAAQRALGQGTGDEQAQDDLDAYQSRVPGGFWRCLPPPKDWQKHVTIQLTAEEAAYLKDRINKAPLTRNSLLAYLTNQDPEKIRAIDRIEDLGRVFPLPDSIRHVYDMAIRFSDFIYGATLRYNVILSTGENNAALNLWEAWRQSPFATLAFDEYNPDEAMDFLRISNYRLRRFLRRWCESYRAGDIETVDELIVQREIEIKSRDRAKLRNPSVYVYQDGHGMRGGKLDYRYGNAKVILADIFDGLEKAHAKTIK
ncbi:MAG: DUF6361 family protein [bacterium]|jgi:hypothetical protein|nr:DUF6361 family protein [Bacillota bacterium]HHT70462.1 hypothetical protein [Bacillota bacterium]